MTTCRTCGSVKVYWGSTLLRKISLYSARTVNRRLINVTTFTSARSGTLTITVSSSGKAVIIDGVADRGDKSRSDWRHVAAQPMESTLATVKAHIGRRRATQSMAGKS